MAHRSGDVAVVRSVGSPLAEDGQKSTLTANEDDTSAADNDEDGDLPQCKIKRNYSCNLCPFFSQNPRSFLYHSRDVHFDRIKIYECSQCLYASKHSQKLQRHVNMIHVNGKNRMKRGVENKVTKPVKLEKKKELKPIKPKEEDTISTAVSEENQGNDVSSTSFEDCGNEDEDDQYVDEEELLDKELKCSVCSFSSRSPSLMRRHERVVHLKKRFLRCSKCSYVTHVKARYTKHVKYHSMPMIKCDLCDFRTPYKWNLDRHYKNHCGSGAFQCSKCNFRADIKQSLTVHEMNHHIPPVGQGAVMARKKNKVGASEASALDSDNIDNDDLDAHQLESEDAEPCEKEVEAQDKEEEKPPEKRVTNKRNIHNSRNLKLPCKRESVNNNLQADFIHPDDIVPRYGQIYVKTLKCKFCSYKAVFSHELYRHEKRIHDYIRPERKKEKPPGRPPPKLIPLQNKVSSTPPTSPILKIPAVRTKTTLSDVNVNAGEPSSPSDKSVNEKEFTEMCKKSCLTSSLKDFVSLIGDEEGLKTIPDSQGDIDLECKSWTESCDEGDCKNVEEAEKKKQTDLLKKKNASFFDKLKEKLLTGTSENCNLICDWCGHESKCLSEAVAHQKRHSNGNGDSEGPPENDIILTGAELSSTRCQHCRQRCKTSTDLINHLKSCKAFGAAHDLQPKLEEDFDIPIKCEVKIEEIKSEELRFEDDIKEELKADEDGNSMENRVFVWNDLPQMHEGLGEEDEGIEDSEMMDISYNEEDFDPQVYGTVTSKGADNTESGCLVAEIDPRFSLSVKKVFKCPHCSFWASTASRFHVHIVGHLNKKPFECSLCMYRSNWRWDITKHIRLKSARDPSHLEATVNMTDETGRRNYSKYNKYLTMMKVQEPSAESSGSGRRSRLCDATQGTITENDMFPLPAPPRLTRAPTPGTAYQIPQGTSLKPPPLLKAVQHVTFVPTTKKTLWKCKKCNFRDSKKDIVLLHVKEHYGKKDSPAPSQQLPSPTPSQPTSESLEETRPELAGSSAILHKNPPFRCGHCHQVSNWKHVIQRHCRLKHNGFVLIELDWRDEASSKQPIDPALSLDVPGAMDECLDSFSCDICPFTTDSEGDLTAHKLNHVDRPGSIFKCTYCPFYVPSKIAVLEHMEVHGIECGVQLATLKFDNFEPSDCNEDFSRSKANDVDAHKRYKCRQCPYVSNSKTQFLYHKQFHKPRGAPFKCIHCSYNVSRRHLLHQHLRVHSEANQEAGSEVLQESVKESQQEKPKEEKKKQPILEVAKYLDPTEFLDTSKLPEIPLVWVLKFGNFLKMFKCRWCPHVNFRKINIQEHEKMHRLEGSSESGHPALKFLCPDCTYTCSNAGVLSSHVKVHQGFYGDIQCLVDPHLSDAEQIQSLKDANHILDSEDVPNSEKEGEADAEKKADDEDTQPEATHNRRSNQQGNCDQIEENRKVLSFCKKCPARFFLRRELRIHSKFHLIRSPFGCPYCSYTARQRPHLLSHYKVHSGEYQKRTAELVRSYAMSLDNPKQKVVIIAEESDVIEGPVWMLESFPKEKLKSESKAKAKYACKLCPAKFFKSVALQYHISLHGGSYKHKCKFCDYTVKTYGNLMRHQLVHEEARTLEENKSFLKKKNAALFAPDDEEHRLANGSKCEGIMEKDKMKMDPQKKIDPQFGSLMHGSPEFIYPTYLKNGKVKEKRYKCHKCPSAFDKRDQYRIHVSLHGSKQKYRCEKCDYSVKYYANYVQHMRKHQSHDEALEARKSRESGEAHEAAMLGEDSPEKQIQTLTPQELALLDQVDTKGSDKEDERRTFLCPHCPYVSYRRDAVESHSRRHFCVSGTKSSFKCIHCDYTATQANFLREHNRLHFARSARHKVEGYMKCEKMELWCVEDTGKKEQSRERLLVFRDKGENSEDRFFPPLPQLVDEEDEENWRIYIDPETGEPSTDIPLRDGTKKEGKKDGVLGYESDDALPGHTQHDGLPGEELIEMVEEPSDDVPVPPQPKPKAKRCRGKNYKCKKCPHAFGKKDQFLRHIALHGSKQKHNCDICDYSVKFYTNYVQHMRMHQMHEPNREIYVKKNAESLEETAKLTKEVGQEAEVLTSSAEEVVSNESDSLGVVVVEETENEYSSLTDGTEVSISSEEGISRAMDENLNPEVVDFAPEKGNISSVLT